MTIYKSWLVCLSHGFAIEFRIYGCSHRRILEKAACGEGMNDPWSQVKRMGDKYEEL